MVRPKNTAVWRHFTSSTNYEGKDEVLCKFCGQKYVFPNATRMLQHLKKCKQCPESVTKDLLKNSTNDEEYTNGEFFKLYG